MATFCHWSLKVNVLCMACRDPASFVVRALRSHRLIRTPERTDVQCGGTNVWASMCPAARL